MKIAKITQKGSTILQDLNEAQRLAVTHGNGPLLIIAGAGTGKTTVLTKRIAWLAEQGIKPEEILALTFTDKAATEMEERVDRLLPYGYGELWISTFHSFAERLLRAHALEIGLSPAAKLLDTTASWLLIRKHLDRFPLKYYRPLGNPSKFIHALLSHFSRARDELISPADYLSFVENLKLNTDSQILIGGVPVEAEFRTDELIRLEELANAYHVYEQLLLEAGALDFGSLLTRSVELLRRRPRLLAHYRHQFKYILVDEFQDTNIAQYELVKLLAAPRNNLAVVGDDDQAIYKFRGASLSNILEFKKDFPQSQEVFLTQNYRSKQDILDLAYGFIQQNNPHRLEAQAGEAGLSKRLVSSTGERGWVRHMHAKSASGEAALIQEAILSLQKKEADFRWNDVAILARANDYAGPIIRSLDEAGIPYALVTARGLSVKPVILDLVSYLKVLNNLQENLALYRVLISPVSRLNHFDISQLLSVSRRKSCPLIEVMRAAGAWGFSPEAAEECRRLAGFLERQANLARRSPVSKVVLTMLEETGYLSLLTKTDTQAHRDSLRYLNEWYRKVTVFETENPGATLPEFLKMLDWEWEAGEEGKIAPHPDEGPEAVKILTCHAAKGLEFRYVFVTNLVDRRFPSLERREPIELPDGLVKETIPEGDIHLEEERRLFYVACTRAAEGLFFTSADDYGGLRKKKASRFLQELRTLGTLPNTEVFGDLSPSPTLHIEREVKNQDTKKMTLPSYFSFTQLKAFETCPLQYKFAHLLKIPVSGRPTFSFGRTIHLTLQRFCQALCIRREQAQGTLFAAGTTEKITWPSAGLPITFEELLGLYQEAWIDDWYESQNQKQAYFEKGKALLKLFYEEAMRRPPTPLHLEWGFHLKLDGYTIRGVIDRLDRLPDGSLEIIDYKTGAAKTEDSADPDQLYIYQLALQEVMGQTPARLTYYYVEDGKRVSFLGSSEDLLKLKEKIRATIQALGQSDFPATPAKEKCRHCDFKNICEFRIL
ncbi:UvrD-helicase domain-containing protein [Candidatus Uhrbacteria bacterium]|nr:UvrD-helicase domain-containing protein [Candidatus Uhrbacteria bacterium]